nr:hypothetical protein [Pseudonocardia sp. H11422]
MILGGPAEDVAVVGASTPEVAADRLAVVGPPVVVGLLVVVGRVVVGGRVVIVGGPATMLRGGLGTVIAGGAGTMIVGSSGGPIAGGLGTVILGCRGLTGVGGRVVAATGGAGASAFGDGVVGAGRGRLVTLLGDLFGGPATGRGVEMPSGAPVGAALGPGLFTTFALPVVDSAGVVDGVGALVLGGPDVRRPMAHHARSWSTTGRTAVPGGAGRWSTVPGTRRTADPRTMSTMTNRSIATDDDRMTVMASRVNPGQAGPRTEGSAGYLIGGVSGLPEEHATTGRPTWSTSTAVPACNTAGTTVAPLLTYP